MGKKSKISSDQSEIKYVLAIETSCDDTSVAIVSSAGFVRAINSQNQDDVHAPFGGVIPELACRNHTMRIGPLIEKSMKDSKMGWDEIGGIVVTSRPGLLGSLLVGVTVAKTLGLVHDLPVLGVNHLEGHLYAPFLSDEKFNLEKNFAEPFVGLCVSGGHTSLVHSTKFGKYKVLGRTLDDAAGEAFDKFGKVIGLGYPAGRLIDEQAQNGNIKAFDFPRPLLHSKDLNFSFSGLKTAGRVKAEKKDLSIEDICASYQEAIVDVLVEKLFKAVKQAGVKRALITGGVASNSRLKARAEEKGKLLGIEVLIAPPRFCTDNAAMIGMIGILRMNQGDRSDLKLSALATKNTSELG